MFQANDIDIKGNKKKLLETAIEMMWAKGFEGSGIAELLAKADVTRSNFYYHFDSKEALFLEALDALFERHVNMMVKPTLLNKNLSPRLRLERFFDCLESAMDQCGCSIGCPFVNLATETSDFHEAFRQKLTEIMEKQEAVLAACYQDGIVSNDFRSDIHPTQAATFILALVKGTLVLTKVRKNTLNIQNNRKLVFQLFSKQ